MGILDMGFDPRTQGLLAAAFQGLQASGPSRVPVSLGQIIGQGGTAGLNEYQQAMKAQLAQQQFLRQSAQTQQLIELEKQKAELTKAQIAKMQRDAMLMEKVFSGSLTGGANPDTLEAVGILGNHPSLLTLAERQRKQAADKATLETLRSQGPTGLLAGQMAPGTTQQVVQDIPPEDVAAALKVAQSKAPMSASPQPGDISPIVKGGLFGGDIASSDPIQSQQGILGQQLVDQSNPRAVDPKHFIDMQARLSSQAAARQQQKLMADMAVSNRAPQAGVAVVGPDGKPIIVAKGQDIGMTPASAVDSSGAITEGAIEDAAARYNLDGTLPPMGMGKAAAEIRSKILNRASEMKAPGVTGEDQRIGQIANKANAAALSKVQQQATMVGAFERNFIKNADIALEYSTKTDKTGVPIVNKWINAGKRAVTGDPTLSAYDAVIKSVVNEYTKIISGSMGNMQIAEGEIKKIESLLTAAQTPEQVKAVIDLMKRETGNRMKGFEEEKANLRNSMKAVPVPTFANEQPSSGNDLQSAARAELKRRGLVK